MTTSSISIYAPNVRPPVKPLSERVEELEANIGGGGAPVLTDRITALENEVGNVQGGALANRVGTNENDIVQIIGGIGTLNTNDPITGRLDTLDNSLIILINGIGTIDGDDPITGRLDVLESDVGTVAAGDDPLANRVTTLEGDVGAVAAGDNPLSGRVTTLEGVVGPIGDPISGRVDTLETGVDSLESAVGTVAAGDGPLSGRVIELEGVVGPINEPISGRVGELETAVGTVAAGDAPLSGRVDTLEVAVGSVAEGADPLADRVVLIESGLGGGLDPNYTHNTRISTIEDALGPVDTQSTVSGRLTILESYVGTVNLVDGDLATRVASLESTLGDDATSVLDSNILNTQLDQTKVQVVGGGAVELQFAVVNTPVIDGTGQKVWRSCTLTAAVSNIENKATDGGGALEAISVIGTTNNPFPSATYATHCGTVPLVVNGAQSTALLKINTAGGAQIILNDNTPIPASATFTIAPFTFSYLSETVV